MARRSNYGFEKRQREIRKQKKKEAKAEEKRLKREAAAAAAGELIDETEIVDEGEIAAGGDAREAIEETAEEANQQLD